MPFNANEFRSSFGNEDVAKANYFDAFFAGLPSFLTSFTEEQTTLPLRIKTSELPGKQLETQERVYNGPRRLVPYGKVQTNMTIEIIEDSSMRLKKFFDLWLSEVYEDTNNNPDPRYILKFYDDFISQKFVINHYKSNGEKSVQVELQEVFPVSVNPVGLSWENRDTAINLSIELAYREWRISE